jgi:orotidine-5'-phosphate decarboxylase
MSGIDRLICRIDETGNPSVVGLDPSLAMMPESLARAMYDAHGDTPRAVAGMFLSFNRVIIDAVADVAAAVKPQIAMYEQYGPDGISAYISTCEYAADRGLYVIGDIKRGDISSTAEAYAAHLSGAEIRAGTEGSAAVRADIWREDAVTVNPYLGSDGVAPFIDACREAGKAVFVLVKTSNRSSAELQDIPVDSGGRRLYEVVADHVESWGADMIGGRGYSSVGAVVGATHPAVGAALTAPRISSAIAKAAARAAEAAAARASSVSRESPPGEFRHAAMIPLDEFTAQPRPSASKKPVRSSARAPWAP